MMLAVNGLSCSFGGLHALDGVSLEVAEGELVGLIGPNGSGKTTLFNVISGLYAPSSGSICLCGRDITMLAPERIVALGLARTFQTPRIYMRMTVLQNLEAAFFAAHPKIYRIGADAAARLSGLLERVGLDARAGELAANLPLAEQRRLELVRTLVADPVVILLDEPAGGMTPAETKEISALIRDELAPGRTCLVIEHKMDMIAALCQRIVVLNFGRIICTGTPAEVLRDPVVLEAYLGHRNAEADA